MPLLRLCLDGAQTRTQQGESRMTEQQRTQDTPDGTQAHRHREGRWLGIHVDTQRSKEL